MADNIYALLQQAWATASTSEATIFGVEVALVTNVKDPKSQGRVKVCYPRLPGQPESDWARVAHPAAGSGRGFYWVPEVHDEVLVGFERGQASKPFVLGALWNGKDLPMKDAYTDENTARMIQTKSGHQILFSDKDGEEKIVIADKSGKRAVTFDVKNKKLVFEAGAGDIELRAEKKIVLECEDLEIKSKKSAKLEVGTEFEWTAKKKGSIDGGSELNIVASRIDINPGGGAGGGLASLAWKAAQAAAAAAAGAPGQGQASKGGGAGGAGAAGAGGAAASPAGGGRGGGGDLGSDVAPAGGTSSGSGTDQGAGKTRDLGGGTAGSSGAGADGGGAGTGGAAAGAGAGTGAAAPGAAAAAPPGTVKVQVVSIAGKPLAGLEFELTAPDGTTKHAGKTGDDGTLSIDGLPKTGDCTLDLPDVKPAPQADPSAAGRIRFVEGGVKVKIGASSTVEAPPRARRGRLTGMLFETDKAFLRPEVMTGIQMLKKLYASVPDLVVLVSGHTDRVGDAQHNLGLSVDRADSVRHFLVDDAAEWMKWYAGTKPNSKKWGVSEDQHMLGAVKDSSGAPFYAGPVNGVQDGPTTAALKSFQSSRLITATGKPDTETRQALVEAYMQLDGAPLPKDPPLQSHGCGKSHPVSPEGAPPEEQVDRRVEVFLFEGQIDPAPKKPCPPGGCAEYPAWVGQTVLTVDLDQPPGALAITVVDEAGKPFPGALVHASGPLVLDGTSAADGTVPGFDALVPGSYKVVADKDGFRADDKEVAVPSGGAGSAQLQLLADSFELKVLVEDQSTPPKPVKGATVTIDAKGAAPQTTGDDGVATFAKVPRGKVHVTAKATGFFDGALDPSLPLVEPAHLALEKTATDVNLACAWLGPDGKERTLPAGMPVTVLFGTGEKLPLALAEGGLLAFPAERARKSFSLQFALKDDKQHLAVAPDADAATKDALVDEASVQGLADKGFRLFLLPKAFDQQTSDWKVAGALSRSFDKLDDRATKVGTKDAPARLVLDPHWQFLRLEHFDRFFGHSDHGHQRVALPPVLLEGLREDPGGTGKKPNPDTRSNWVVEAADPLKARQALPWILPKGADGKGAAKPDAKILLQLSTAPGTFVVSSSKDDRKLEVIADAARLKPSAERLKLYDLPPLWRSRGWFARQGAAGAFFDKLTAAQVAGSLATATPLVFSLDDTVLCDENKKQVTLAPADRVAVFFHRFVSAPEAGATSPLGVYKPDGAAKLSYFSARSVATKAYLTDYPNWTRLVVAQGNLFEAFAERTADDAANDAVGARAAVRWVDSIAKGVAAGTVMANRPARVDHDFFAVQPFFEQHYNQTNQKYKGQNTAPTQSIGRFDMALLRCCDRDGDQEQAVSLHYFRMFYDFNNTPPPQPPPPPPPAVPPPPTVFPPSPFHPAGTPAVDALRANYLDSNCANMAARWNGNEAGATRAELIPKSAADKLKAQVVFFVQPSQTAARAHFSLQIVRPGAGQLGGRSWMSGSSGTGELGEDALAPESTFTAGSYVAAHELGHGDSLPDEYSERAASFVFSGSELPFHMNTPGDIYETDGANWDPAAVTQADSGLMNGVQIMRNRYFWHSAEFASAVTGKRFLVKVVQRGETYDKYEVPPHELVAPEAAPAAPKRSYIYWPIQDRIDDSAGGRSRYDLLLYTMGEDRFTKDLLVRKPVDGTLVMMVRLLFTFDPALAAAIPNVLPALRNAVRADHGDKFFATGTVRAGTPQSWQFRRCLIRLQPRFLITNLRPAAAGPDQSRFDGLLNNIGAHFTVNVGAATPPNSRWQAAAPNRALLLEGDPASPTLDVDLATAFRDKFAEMFGLANRAAVTKDALKPYVQKVIGGGDVDQFV